MNAHSPSHRPASQAEASAALRVLFESGLPFQRGTNPDTVAAAYLDAVRGFTVEAIEAGIRKFNQGECPDVSDKYVPTAPQLAKIIRSTVVPHRIVPERRIPERVPDAGERARMRLKMPMWCYAFGSQHLMSQLDRANREGFTAMAALAQQWGIEVPEELYDNPQADREWIVARNRCEADLDRNPPPYLRQMRA